MALKSICPNCGGSSFEASVESIRNLNSPLVFIRCISCRAVVGVKEIYDIGVELYDLKNAVNELQRLKDAVKRIADAMKVNVDL